MSRLTFNTPFMLGFDNLDRMIDQIAKTGSEGFPPYNVEQISESMLRITLAVAGYAEENLDISVEDNQLVVSGHRDEKEDHQYLYKGIATRSFKKTFVLAHGMEVHHAFMENGLLCIDLLRPENTELIKKIKIETRPVKEVCFNKKGNKTCKNKV